MICIINIILWISFCVGTTPAARISKFMDPRMYLATKDVIVLPEDYEDEFSNLDTTSIGIPEEDYYYNTDTNTAFREASDDSYMSGQENKKSFSSNEDNFYHEISTIRHRIDTVSTKKLYDTNELLTISGNKYDPWPSIPPRYIFTSSSTEYLTMPQSEYSPSKMTWKSYFPTRPSNFQNPNEFKILHGKPTQMKHVYRYEENEKSTLDWEIYKMFTRVPIATRFGNHYYSELEEFEEFHSTHRKYSKKPYFIKSVKYEISPKLNNVKKANENPRLSTKEFRRPYPESKMHYGEPFTEIIYHRRTFPELTTVKNKPYDIKVNETNMRVFLPSNETSTEITDYKRTFRTEKTLNRKPFSKKNMLTNKFHSSFKTKYSKLATEMIYSMKTYSMEKTPYEIPNDIELGEITKRYYGKPASQIGHEITYTAEKKTPFFHLQETDVSRRYSLNKTYFKESNAESPDYERSYTAWTKIYNKILSSIKKYDSKQVDSSEKPYYKEHVFQISEYDNPTSTKVYNKDNYYNAVEQLNKQNLLDKAQKEPDLVIKMSDYGESYTTRKPNEQKPYLPNTEDYNEFEFPNEEFEVNLYGRDFTHQSSTAYEPYDQEFELKAGGNKTTICYQCGMDESGLTTDKCYRVFDSPSRLQKSKMKFHKTKCSGKTYIGGCFKRFLDIGIFYNERGCRHNPPMTGRSLASKRYASIENLLHGIKDGCTVSPLATLVQLSRPISLYARFHVCVCISNLCNNSPTISGSFYILLFIFIYVYLSNHS